MSKNITVLGGGSWGTALANLLATNGHSVTIWAREAEVCSSINSDNENSLFLPGIKLPKNIKATQSLEEALKDTSLIISVIPSQYLRDVLTEALSYIKTDDLIPIVSATKGIEESTLMTASIIIREITGGAERFPIAVLSGPTFAKEVALKLPSCITAAADGIDLAETIQGIFSNDFFRVYTNTDIIGVEIGGAVKNVIALASGISNGLGFGYNTRAALITRGLVEMKTLGIALGGVESTFYGLSGMGDLILTATGELSRNFTVGTRLGRGEKLTDIIESMHMVAEGVKTCRGVMALAKKHNVEMPITNKVFKVLYEDLSPKDGVTILMTRDLGEE